jgi:mannose-6-phosphate isomerase-like protein (cupin superfamily)
MSEVKKQFRVLGDLVEVLVTSAETNGSFCVIRQYPAPGGGPPPHMHTKEDEHFIVVEGEFEIYDGLTWLPINTLQTAFTLRGNLHTFRNRGTARGCIQITVVPGGLDTYLEELSKLPMPPAMEDVVEISDSYGISFPPGQ